MTAHPPLHSELRNSQLVVRKRGPACVKWYCDGEERICERHSVRSPSGIRPWVRHPGRSAQCLPASPCLAIACLSPPPKASSHSSSACRVPSVALRPLRGYPGGWRSPRFFWRRFFFFSEKRPREIWAPKLPKLHVLALCQGRGWCVFVCS